LSEVYYAAKAAGLQEGSKEEQEAAEKAFNLNKGIELSIATINGLQATLAAFAAGSKFGPIVGAAYAAAAGIVAAATIAKIANTKFTPTASSAPASPSAPNIPAPAPVAPTFNTPTTGLNPDGTPIGSNNGTPTQSNVVVYEGDINAVTNRVKVLEGRALF